MNKNDNNMGAFENFEQLKTFISDCEYDTNRLWHMNYEPFNNEHVIYRYDVCNYNMKMMREVAGDVIDFCKDFIENNPDIDFASYTLGGMNIEDTLLDIKGIISSKWRRPTILLLGHYDEVKIYDQRERTGDCLYYWNGERQLWSKPKGSNQFSLMSNYQDQNHVLFEYCELREDLEYKLLSRLCRYINEYEQRCVSINCKKELTKYAQAVILYTAMYNERKQVLKDAKHARLNLEELQTTTPEPQGKRTKPVKIPHELNTPKGKKLLQKVIKAGYCDKYYNWDDTKWLPGRSRLALACFAYRASAYLNLSTKMDKEGKYFTSWQPFEILFTYQGKEEGKNKLMQTKRDYMKAKTSFNPEEMAEISKLFH